MNKASNNLLLYRAKYWRNGCKKKVANLDVTKICPLHGPILTENLEYYINKYDVWSSYKPEDEGVLIASSSHGYKIPTCVKDILTYIEQTDTIVSPMLSRIGKCRTLIKKSTDGKLDVLDSKQFSGYKRYFGDY